MDWTKLKAGDDEAWIDAGADLFPAAKRAAKAQCPGLSGDEVKTAALAALQEMIDGIEDVPSEKDLWGRLISCARLRAIDENRKKGRQGNFLAKADSIDVDHAAGHDQVDERTRSASEEVKYIELTTVAAHVLENHDPEDVQLLSEVYFEGLSHREIGEKRGWGTNSVGSRINQALKRAHKWLCSDDRFKEFCSSYP